MKLYHGSTKIIQHPEYGKGNPYNDYGPGFYMTESIDLAMEWACTNESDGYANAYQLDINDLSVLYLTRGNYHILNWLAILVSNRVFEVKPGIVKDAKDCLLRTFLPDYENFDVICGYRADDAYFSFAKDFLNNSISLEELERAMHLGKLGEQYCIRSLKAFSNLHYCGCEMAERKIWFPQKCHRDKKERDRYFNRNENLKEGIYMIDIIREGWSDADERLQPIISG